MAGRNRMTGAAGSGPLASVNRGLRRLKQLLPAAAKSVSGCRPDDYFFLRGSPGYPSAFQSSRPLSPWQSAQPSAFSFGATM